MIPTHVLAELQPRERVAILARGRGLHFLVHDVGDEPAKVQEYAARDGSEVLITHMRDKAAILEFVAARERDLGGES